MPIKHEGATYYSEEELDAAKEEAAKARAKNHGAKLAELQAKLDEANTKIGESTAALKERDKLAKRVGELEGQLGETTDRLALTAVGIADEKAAKRLRAAYKTDIEGNEKPPSFADWLKGDGAEDVARYAPATPAATTKTEAGATNAAAPATPPVSTRTTTPGTQAAAAAKGLTNEVYASKMTALLAERGKLPADKRGEIDAKITALKAEKQGTAAAA